MEGLLFYGTASSRTLCMALVYCILHYHHAHKMIRRSGVRIVDSPWTLQ